MKIFISMGVAVAFTVLPMTVGAQVAKGDAKAGRQKAEAICSGCHTVPGTKTAYPEVYHVPKLAGQNEGYIAASLVAYKAGQRYNDTMKAVASSLSDKEISNIAAYYAEKR